MGALGLGLGEETTVNGGGASGEKIRDGGVRERGDVPVRGAARERGGAHRTVADLDCARRSGVLCARVQWRS